MSFSLYWPGLGVEVFEQVLQRPDDRLAGALHDARVADREGGGGDPADDDDHHRRGEQPKPDPAVIVSSRVDVVEVDQNAGGEHQRHVDHDEDQEPDQHQEMHRASDLDTEDLADPLEPRRQRRGHAQSGDQGKWGGDKDGDEVGDQLQTVIGRPAILGRPVQRQVLDHDRQRVGKHVPAGRYQPLPPIGRKQQDVEDRRHSTATARRRPDATNAPGQWNAEAQEDRPGRAS